MAIGAILQGVAALANVAVGIEGINEAKRARRDANKQLGIENDRYDNALKKQENFLNEVNASATNFEAPEKENKQESYTPIADSKILNSSVSKTPMDRL